MSRVGGGGGPENTCHAHTFGFHVLCESRLFLLLLLKNLPFCFCWPSRRCRLMTFVPALIGNFYPLPEVGDGRWVVCCGRGRATFVILKFKIQFTCVINLIAHPEATPQAAALPVDLSLHMPVLQINLWRVEGLRWGVYFSAGWERGCISQDIAWNAYKNPIGSRWNILLVLTLRNHMEINWRTRRNEIPKNILIGQDKKKMTWMVRVGINWFLCKIYQKLKAETTAEILSKNMHSNSPLVQRPWWKGNIYGNCLSLDT